MESKLHFNRKLFSQKSRVINNIRFQCDFLIQIMVDLKECVNNKSISYEHAIRLQNLLCKANSDCKLFSQAVTEISDNLEKLDTN